MVWIHDLEHGVIWHRGATGSCNSYLAFSPERGRAVVVLSSLSPRSGIPATIPGLKLLSGPAGSAAEETRDDGRTTGMRVTLLPENPYDES